MTDSPSDWGQKPGSFPPPTPFNYPSPGPSNYPPPGPISYPPPGPSSYPPPGPTGYPPPGSPEANYLPPYQSGPTQPAPGPYQGPADTGPKGGRRVWPWIFGVLLLIVAGVGGCVAWVVNLAKAPVEATNAFVAQLDDGHLDAAYRSLCSPLRAQRSFDDFQADQSAASAITGYTFTSVAAATGELTQVSGTISINGVPRSAAYGLRQEDGVWKVCDYDPLQ